MEQRIYDTYVHLLERELVPAMGCTEPIAVAYAAAVATRELGVLPETVDICEWNPNRVWISRGEKND